mgnify:CR=1 FL=1
MLGNKEQFIPILKSMGYESVCPEFEQTLTEEKLIKLVPECEGWIIGDDPATRKVFQAGVSGKLKAAVKWGIGVDNVDFDACKEFGIPVTNTPGMFGNEVADVAIGYLLSLSRRLHLIDRDVRSGDWPKHQGISLKGKTVGVIGYGDIGKQTVLRCEAFGLKVIIYDPEIRKVNKKRHLSKWPSNIDKCDFLILTCSLNSKNFHMINEEIFLKCKTGVRIINVARGQLICEDDLNEALSSGKVHSVALDVFEQEPIPKNSFLFQYPDCILGSHNSSNTKEAVEKTNIKAINLLLKFLEN